MMVGFFLDILEITAGVSILVLIMLLILRLIGEKFTSKCRYILWTLVIIRLAIPFSFHFLPSFVEVPLQATEELLSTQPSVDEEENEGFTDNTFPSVDVGTNETPFVDETVGAGTTIPSIGTGNTYVPSIPTNPVIPTVPTNPVNPTNPTVPSGSATLAEPDMNIPTQEQISVPEPIPETPKEPVSLMEMLEIVSFVYLAGAVSFFLWNVISYVIYTNRILRTARSAEKKTLEIFLSICEKYGMRTIPRLLVSREVSSPAAFGIFRQTIVLPDITLTGNALVGTLSHEIVHCKRSDLLIKVLELFARSLHWFNPLVHIAAFRCEMEMEMSCDETVLAGCSDEVRVAYGKVMLDIIRRCRRGRGALTTHFNPKKNSVKSRFANIINGSGTRRGKILIPVCLALCVLAGAVVSCTIAVDKKGEETKEPDETTEITEITALYDDFLSEKINAVDKDGNAITLGDCVRNDPNAAYKKYAIYDMNGDDWPELIVKTSYELNIFAVSDGKVTLWYHGTNYEKPLDNGTILYERPGGAPPHTSYAQIELGSDGEEIARVSFEKYQGSMDETTYFVNSVQVTEEEYKKVADPILALSDGKITWNELPYGTVQGDKEPVVEQEYVKVHSNAGGIDFKTILLPKDSAQFHKFDEEHYLFASYNNVHDENGKFLYCGDYTLHLINTVNGTLVDQYTISSSPHNPTQAHYIDDGLVLFDMEYDQISAYSVPYAVKITIEDGKLTATETEMDAFPYHRDRLISPDNTYIVYHTADDGWGNGGVDVVYPGGTTKRILTTFIGEGTPPVGNAQTTRGYRPVQFIDDHRFLYDITAWEGVSGYGIYDILTDEKTEFFGGYAVKGYSDGYVYLTRSENYEVVEWYKATLDGEITKIASVKEEEGVYHVPNFREYSIYAENMRRFYSVDSDAHLNGNGDGITVTICSPDVGDNAQTGNAKVYAEVTFDCTKGKIYALCHGKTFTSVVFAEERDRLPEETAEPVESEPAVESYSYLDIHSNAGGLDFNEIFIPGADDIRLFGYDERYSIVITRDAEKNLLTFYVLDSEKGELIESFNLSGQNLPSVHHYTTEGMLIRCLERGEGESFIAYLVSDANGKWSISHSTKDSVYPQSQHKIISPDGKYTVFGIYDDQNQRGGIDVVFPDGSVKRIMENRIYDEYGLQEYALFFPEFFVDNTRFVYYSTDGIALYDISTGENRFLAEEMYIDGYSDGYVYCTKFKKSTTSQIWKCDLKGEKTLIASLPEELDDKNSDIPTINMYDAYDFHDGMWFVYHNWSMNAVSVRKPEDPMILTVYTADLREVLAEVEYPSDLNWSHTRLICSGNTANLIVNFTAEEAYDLVLDNKMLIHGTETEYLDEYLERSGHYIIEHTVIDLDGDTNPEMVLKLGHGENDSHGSLIVHFENGMVYGYELWYRMFYCVKEDGTFHFSGGGPNDGTGRIEFSHGSYSIIKLSYGEEGDNGDITWYVEGNAVTREEYETYQSAQDKKNEPVWVKYTAET